MIHVTKNNFFIFLIFLIFSCKGQTNDKNIELNKISNKKDTIAENPQVANVKIGHDDEYIIRINKLGEISVGNPERNIDNFTIILDMSIIKIKNPYKIFLKNYADKNEFLVTMKKLRKDEYLIEILQYTKHLTIDKFYFKSKNKDFKIIKIENVQTKGDELYICQYPALVFQKDDIIDLTNDSLIFLNCVTTIDPLRIVN